MARAKLKKNTRSKVMGKTSQAIAAVKVWGTETQIFPEHTILSDLDLGRHLAWYNNVKSNLDAKSYLLEYLQNSNDERYTLVQKTNEKLIRPTAGWMARMITLGLTLSNQQRDTFERLVDESGRSKAVIDENSDDAKIIPIQTITKPRKILTDSDVIGDIEYALDHWRTTAFNLTQYLTERKLPSNVGRAIVNYYDPLQDELDLALEGKTKDLNEGYARFKKTELRQYYDFVYNIIHEAMAYSKKDDKPKVRKVRQKKEIPLDKKVSLLQYMQTSPNHRSIKSLDPKRIVGAKELWTFDTVSKRLIVFRSQDDKGLDLYRSSVTNYNPETSHAKKIGRSTNMILDKVFLSPRLVCKEIFDSLNNDVLEITGRVNKNTLLIKVFNR